MSLPRDLERPSSISSLASDQPDISSPSRMAIHITEVRKVNAYAPRFHPGVGLGGSHRYGEDLSLRLFQRLALCQQHQGLTEVSKTARPNCWAAIGPSADSLPSVPEVRVLIIYSSLQTLQKVKNSSGAQYECVRPREI